MTPSKPKFVAKKKTKTNYKKKDKKIRPEKDRKQIRYYPVDDVVSRKGKKPVRNPPRLRASIQPGTILLLVSTKHRGKRVIFLKQMASGLLLVIGPYGVNGVPLTRVDQSHVIATSTQIDISGIKIPERINDKYFRSSKIQAKKEAKEKKDELFVQEVKISKKPPTEHIEDAKAIEGQLVPIISKVSQLKAYLKTPFSLSNGQFPHQLVF
ncbi:60S ribosomal protein L6 [Thelohanellus kitauei]|uniref:Large ribosomal subunit protein eL6 n=1 Tax=Thelohanellus kitauei TaxID=669202 RepID=A0A0C2MFR9_THEKT|nr:60S ribosomal protein L6 [Thelohanellus kitauei]